MSQTSTEIADEFFDKQDVTTVDFEITLAALLGTAAITYPVKNHALYGQMLAFSLLFLTLLRRMAITSPFAPEETLLRKTVPLISFISASSIIYLFVAVLPILTGLMPIASQVTAYSVFVLIVLIVGVTAQELMFRDYFPWWHVKFKQKSEQMDLLETVWRDTSRIAYWASVARRHRESYRELGDRLGDGRPDLSDFEFQYNEAGRHILAVSLLVVFLYLLPVLYSGYLLGLPGLLVIPAVVGIHDHSAFLYIAYGNPSYEDLRQHVLTILVRTGLYATEVAFLLSELKISVPI